MKIIIWSRGLWKTTQMLKYLDGKWIYIVCKDQKAVQNLWKTILDNKYNIPMPVTAKEQLVRNWAVFIEDIDLVLPEIKDKWVLDNLWINFMLDIEWTLVREYVKRGLTVEWYTQNINNVL